MQAQKTNGPVFVIMAGGAGERFWPVSNRTRPKQLVRLEGQRTLLEVAFDRAMSLGPKERIYIVAGVHLRREIEAVLPHFQKENYIGEPFGRNTAACLGLAACHLASIHGPETVMAVLTADHLIEEGPAFKSVVEAGLTHAAMTNDLVTIGIQPTHSDPAFGYLELGDLIGANTTPPGGEPVRRVTRFREKPDRRTAQQFIEQGNFLWNSGMFFWRISTLLQAYQDHQPEMAEQWSRLRNFGGKPPYPGELLEEVYEALPSLPIDKAIMEHSENVAAVTGRFRWNDVGSWDALARVRPTDPAGNCLLGSAIVLDSHNNIIYNEQQGNHGPEIVVYGLNDCVIVKTDKAILITPKTNVQGVKNVVRHLSELHREDLL